jgi:hypothetical protein
MSRPQINAIVIGFQKPAEIDEVLKIMNSALAYVS